MHVVKLSDGTNTITLTSSPYGVNQYLMATSNITVNQVQGALMKDRFQNAEYAPINDRIKIFIVGSNPSDAQAKYSAIETMLQFAIRSINTKSPQNVEIQIQMSTDSDLWKADLFYGSIQPTEDIFTGLPQSVIEAEISLTRGPFKGPLTQLALSNAHGSGTAVTIYNHNDSGQDNFVDVTSTIAGSLPAPVKIRLKNNSGSDKVMKNIFIGINSHSDPDNLNFILEGEDSLFGSTVASATSSNGEHQTFSVSQASSVGAAFAWLLDSTTLSRTKGESFVMLARFKGNPPADVSIAPQVGTYDSPLFLPTWTGQEVLVEDFEELVNLGTINLPSPTYVAGSNYSYGVAIAARGLSAGSKTLTLDYVMLVPSDSWANMQQITSLTTANNEFVCLDEVESEYTYQKASPTFQKLSVFKKFGPPLKVWPNKDNRIMVVWEDLDEANINYTTEISAWYEPMRLTV